MKGYRGLPRASTLEEQIVAGVIAAGVGLLVVWWSK